MSKKKMQAARELIEKEDYRRARAILKTVDHPMARQWEARLDAIEKRTTASIPTHPSKSGAGQSRRWLFLSAAVVLVVVVVVVVMLLTRSGNPPAASPTADVAAQPTATAITESMPTDAPMDVPADVPADVPTAPADVPTQVANLPAAASDDQRPGKLPADFPFPEGGFTPVFDMSRDDVIFISVLSNSDYTLEELAAYYRSTLSEQGYEFAIDSVASPTGILSFLGDAWQGSVRFSSDGENGEIRLTIEIKPAQFANLNEAATAAVSDAPVSVSYADPVEATRAFMNAIAVGDYGSALALVCDDLQPQFTDQVLGAFGPTIPGGVVDFSTLDYTVISREGRFAEVQMSGKYQVTITANNAQMAFDMTETSLVLRDDDGWRICPVE